MPVRSRARKKIADDSWDAEANAINRVADTRPIVEQHHGIYEEVQATQKSPDPDNQAYEHLRAAMIHLFHWSPTSELASATPRRFLKYLKEFSQDTWVDGVLGKLFPVDHGDLGIVVQGNIPFRMICEHHLLPAIGKAWVGYLPRKKVVGLSKIARLVDAVGTSCPSMQEKLCAQIADVLNDHTEANGTICVVRSLHTCMACRGVNVPDTVTTSSAVRGIFLTNPAARQEFFQIAGIGSP